MNTLQRSLEKDLLLWNQSAIRSPLILIGPRQVGKTTLLKRVAHKIGIRVFEVNFWEDNSHTLKGIFKKSGNPHQIIKDLADYFNVNEININEDVLFIDEIQECPEAYSSLKSFKEKIGSLRILITGSYLQLFLNHNILKKLPVGCVDEFHLDPLSFSEFLQSCDNIIFEKYKKLTANDFHVSIPLHNQLLEKMNEYFFVGGLPEIVNLYASGVRNVELKRAVRKKQTDLISQYTLDFQKYGKSIHIKKIDKLFQNIPFQLDKSNDEPVDRFQFKELGENAKYNVFHWSFQFLENAGLILRSFIINTIDIPFRAHQELEERNLFKCFYFDMGLLGAALNTPLDFSLDTLGSYKGYIAENFIAIHLKNLGFKQLITYKKTSKRDSAEVEFLISDSSGGVIPIEVKSSKKSLKSKSLDSFITTYKPTRAYKLIPTTGESFDNKNYLALPLYMIEKILS